MPSLVDRYLDRTGSRSRIAQKTRRSSRDGPGKSRRELYGFSKEEALGRISNELFRKPRTCSSPITVTVQL
jgi:hypothetical protein